jgi:N utilization substance protein B
MPNEKQLKYIRQLVTGVESTARSWTPTSEIRRGLEFFPHFRVASAIMRVAMYEILYMPEIPTGAPSTKRWKSPKI